ncbi:TPA: hypothetical protein RG685_000591 [Morganella morganii]|nr:hypothetical protein [Morganella morganii]
MRTSLRTNDDKACNHAWLIHIRRLFDVWFCQVPMSSFDNISTLRHQV